MRAAGPWRAVSPVRCTRFLARCRPGSRPSSSAVADLIADSRGPGLEEVALTECLSSPPLSCSNSTLSLLSPLGHQSFPFGEDDSEGEDEDAVDEDARESEAKVASLEGMELPGHSSCEVESQDKQQKQVQLRESSLTPWEMWFVGKEKEERGRLQQKVLEERKEREQKINKEMEEKAAKKLEKEHLQEKSKAKYQEWLKKKNAEECEKKKKEKEKEKQRQAELQEKKEIAEKKFKEWLENAKNKPRPTAKSYGYASGKLTGFYSGNSYPEPTFYNPIPWKPIHMPPPKEAKSGSGKKSKRSASSQPLTSSSLVVHKAKNSLSLGTLCRVQR
ncbi:Ccdc34 [Phodopus roborovskii]|uniref:Ccdc34 protein n=1 Tax=Phodopus roborovskii TaxID=109678 RepID=A0AAU9Z5Z0_PHORO|nr:Ccdc34 [Phodopus roborovskii]